MVRNLDDELVALSDPWSAYCYARDVIGGRWHQAEKIIMSDANAAYSYARDVIGGRWEEAEKIISAEGLDYVVYEYARDVIRSRWIEGEHYLMHHEWRDAYLEDIVSIDDVMKDPILAAFYSYDVIKERWIEMEPLILTCPEAAYYYVESMVENELNEDGVLTWEEAEHIIMTDAEHASTYCSYSERGRWPEAEKVIMTDPYSAYKYAEYAIKGRWEAAEKIISSSAEIAYCYAAYVIKGRWNGPYADQAERSIASGFYRNQYLRLS